jgi:hypothetical protein
MAYRVKNPDLKKKETFLIQQKADKYKAVYEELDDEAYLEYNSTFNELGKKEQKEIALKVAKQKGVTKFL